MLLLFVFVPNQENIQAASVSDNIHIRIRNPFVNMKTEVVRALSDPHPIRLHP